MQTIAVCTATVNPEKAQQALNRLIEEQFPEVSKDRANAVERAMAIMEKEKDRAYAVTAMGGKSKGNSWERAQHILRNKRKKKR